MRDVAVARAHRGAPDETCAETMPRPSPNRAAPRGLLSCPLNRSGSCCRVRHRRCFLSPLKSTLRFVATLSTWQDESPGAPCTLPRSATGWFGCTKAALEPSRRISPSDSRGSITGTPAWSTTPLQRPATGKITCVPSSLVCTSSHPPRRSSVVQKAAVVMTRGCLQSWFVWLIDAHPTACDPSAPRARQRPVRPPPDRRHRPCRRPTSHA